MGCLRTCCDKDSKNFGYEDCLTCKDNDNGLPKIDKKLVTKFEYVVQNNDLEIVELLHKCKQKLRIYRLHTDGEYLDGVEYENLIWQIDEMVKKITSTICKEALNEKD